MSVARGRALGLLAGLGADAVLGDPPNRWHPTAWFGTWAGWLERRCYAGSVAAGVGFEVGGVPADTLVGVGGGGQGGRRAWVDCGLEDARSITVAQAALVSDIEPGQAMAFPELLPEFLFAVGRVDG